MFSGLNLAFFSLSRLRLEAEAGSGNPAAVRILKLRRNADLLLTTILWGNVAINVLLTLLSRSVMLGAAAFVVSTFLITFAGEILPQACFSRRAMKMASLLSPVMRIATAPIVIDDPAGPLGHILAELKRGTGAESDAAIEKYLVLLWTDGSKKVITGADLPGRLLTGI